jgi:hypothetical protein
VSARIRAGSSFKRSLWFVLIDIRCFPVPPEVGTSQVEDLWYRCLRFLAAMRATYPAYLIVLDLAVLMLKVFVM